MSTEREAIRARAGYACEYCGIREAFYGSEMTVDHWQQISKGGSDDVDNLVSCCDRCNQFKHDYWPSGPTGPFLWNPRTDRWEAHFELQADGTVRPLTDIGRLTVERLHLNRRQLVEGRRRKLKRAEAARRLAELRRMRLREADQDDRAAEASSDEFRLLQEYERLMDDLLNEPD